jgi:N-acetylneuraminic acid mutarotase
MLQVADVRVTPSLTYFSMVASGAHIYFFGGLGGDSKERYSHLRIYDAISGEWSVATPTGTAPPALYLHAAAALDGIMYVFGGSSLAKEVKTLFAYNMHSNTWSTVKAVNEALTPTARHGHATAACHGSFLVAGGCFDKSTYYKTTHCLDLASLRWRKLGDIPLAMAYHSLCTYDDRVLLFGGYNEKTFQTNVHVLSWETGQWERLHTTGPEPRPRCGCAMQVVGDEMWVFGGYTSTGHVNDLHCLNLLTLAWELVLAPAPPISRA